MMTNNKSCNGMTVVGVVVVAAVLVFMIQTSTTSAARPNGVLPPAFPTVQVAATSDIHRPCRPRAASTGNVQVAPATVRTDKVVVAAPTSDVDRPVPASVNTDKVQIAAAASDAVLPKAAGEPGPPELVHLAPDPAELAGIDASKDVADHPEALDIVGGP